LTQKLADFFERKGLPAIKAEDRMEQWYQDWLDYQASHQLYAKLLSPRQFSKLGTGFDLLRYARFLEVFAYFSPAHGYSLQVTFLGLFAILMGTNSTLKQEAVAALARGGLLAFGVSEKGHGSDLLGNDFTVTETAAADQSVDGKGLMAEGSKYYIGNANCATIVSILARKLSHAATGRSRRAPMLLFALRPDKTPCYQSVQKIRTLGVRSAYVGELRVEGHAFGRDDVIAEGRQAWDAVFGTVTLGKFFLSFGAIGICEHALQEAAAHLGGRLLYGRPAIEMPHLRWKMVEAFARLTAMKLYAYRALDYVHAATAEDRRYLLYAAVQKARVSTEGVAVMALLSECIGARGFEGDTFFEMALRDAQLIPGLEGSAHINLGLTAQFLPQYFNKPSAALEVPASLAGGEVEDGENPYLMDARTGAVAQIAFPGFLDAYRPLMSIGNVRLFVRQAKAFQLFARVYDPGENPRADTRLTQTVGQCVAAMAYGQLVAENAVRLGMPDPMVAALFHAMVEDFNKAALSLASCRAAENDPDGPAMGSMNQRWFRRMVCVPRLTEAEVEFVAGRLLGYYDIGRQPTDDATSNVMATSPGQGGHSG
jgi:acyl-CoA dehydrogenase